MLLLGSLEVIASGYWGHFFNLTSWLVVEKLEPGATHMVCFFLLHITDFCQGSSIVYR
jgi:hypothetical protein